MYREPVTLSIKGKFALNGRNWNNDSYDFISNANDRLTSIQRVFEYIKNAGLLCTITTVATEMDGPDKIYYETNTEGADVIKGNINPSNTRFLTRSNMVLTGINWTEKQNVLDFTFNFTEVIMIDTEEYEVDFTDPDSPSLAYPRAQSVGSVLLESGQLPEAIIRALYDDGYIENDFLRWCSDYIHDKGIIIQTLVAVGIAVGVIIGSVALASAIGLAALGSTALVFPVGTVIAAAAAGIIATVAGISAIIHRHEKEEKQKKAFKLAKDADEAHAGDEDYNRLCNLIDDVEASVNRASGNITIYNFSSDEEQTICLSIGGQYYYITITKTSDYPYMKADIRVNAEGNNGDPISNRRTEWAPCTNIMELNENVNMWFKDENKQYEVYLVNPALDDAINKTDEEKKIVWQMLTQYTIWVSKGHIKEQIQAIEQAIDDSILEHDFT